MKKVISFGLLFFQRKVHSFSSILQRFMMENRQQVKHIKRTGQDQILNNQLIFHQCMLFCQQKLDYLEKGYRTQNSMHIIQQKLLVLH